MKTVIFVLLLLPSLAFSQDPKDPYGVKVLLLWHTYYLVQTTTNTDLRKVWEGLSKHKDSVLEVVDPLGSSSQSFILLKRYGQWLYPIDRKSFQEICFDEKIRMEHKAKLSIKSDVRSALERWEAYWVTGKNGDEILIFVKDNEWYDVTRIIRVVPNKIEIFLIHHTQK